MFVLVTSLYLSSSRAKIEFDFLNECTVTLKDSCERYLALIGS